MMQNLGEHLDPETAEEFSLGRLPESGVERVEEHLLICQSCRDLVEESDSFVNSIRAASAELRRAGSSAVAVALTRSAGTVIAAPADRALQLHPNLAGLAATPSYHLKLLDKTGDVFWQGDVPAGSAASVPPQRPGTLCIRIYSTTGELLREYDLELRG
jgi:hypothetical protein